MSRTKPIRVFWSELSNRFYATQAYREEVKPTDDGILRTVTITGAKYDVTQDIASAIDKYGVTFKSKRAKPKNAAPNSGGRIRKRSEE